jgi:hypothetical protein
VGGVNEVFNILFGLVVSGFAYVTGTSILAKALYNRKIDECDFEGHDHANGLTRVERLKNKEASYEQILPPTYLECKYIFYRCCCCFRKKFKFERYWNTLERVDRDLSTSMDLVTFMRRISMHGFALTIMLQKY